MGFCDSVGNLRMRLLSPYMGFDKERLPMSEAKRLMILGGSRYILPVIEASHELGAHVITADYLPDNIAHKFSDEYCDVSIVDKEAVLEKARELRIDGIMSFAADPGVVTASYVAEQMGLPFQGSYESVRVLQNKDLFRGFLAEHDFNVPRFVKVGGVEEAETSTKGFDLPVIVKPTDSAGSKGVTRIDDWSQLGKAVETALSFSLSSGCIIEEFIEKMGCSSDADAFTKDGVFTCVSFTDQLFDPECDNPYAPSAYVMPASMPKESQKALVSELNRLAQLLELRNGIYNIETRVGTNGKPYIMEVSPRGGGNRLAEMLRYATSIDLIKASVQAALGLDIDAFPDMAFDGVWYQEILHSIHGGRFEGVVFPEDVMKGNVAEVQLWIESDTDVEGFSAANHAFGTAFLYFPDRSSLSSINDLMRQSVKIK